MEVWNGIWNGRFLVWNGNRIKKIASMEYGKIVFHFLPCPAATQPITEIYRQGRRQLSEIRGAKLKTGGGGKVLTVNYCSILRVK